MVWSTARSASRVLRLSSTIRILRVTGPHDRHENGTPSIPSGYERAAVGPGVEPAPGEADGPADGRSDHAPDDCRGDPVREAHRLPDARQPPRRRPAERADSDRDEQSCV